MKESQLDSLAVPCIEEKEIDYAQGLCVCAHLAKSCLWVLTPLHWQCTCTCTRDHVSTLQFVHTVGDGCACLCMLCGCRLWCITPVVSVSVFVVDLGTVGACTSELHIFWCRATLALPTVQSLIAGRTDVHCTICVCYIVWGYWLCLKPLTSCSCCWLTIPVSALQWLCIHVLAAAVDSGLFEREKQTR